MPSRPPIFRPPGWKERPAWQPRPGYKDQRKRGRAGQRDRAQVLAEEPFCRKCVEDGLYVASDEVDHILALAAGGSDERSNKQALCKPHHEAKSKAERLVARHGPRRSSERPRG